MLKAKNIKGKVYKKMTSTFASLCFWSISDISSFRLLRSEPWNKKQSFEWITVRPFLFLTIWNLFLTWKNPKMHLVHRKNAHCFYFLFFKVAARVILFPVGCASGFFFQLTKHFTFKQSCFLKRAIKEGSDYKATFFLLR